VKEMATKYKDWEFDNDFTVEDLINLTDPRGRKPHEQFLFQVNFWEGKRIKKVGTKKITIKIKYKELLAIQEAVMKSFL